MGIDAYRGGISPLRSAVSDAKAVAETLRRDHAFETCCMFDGDAGIEELQRLLTVELPAILGPADRLLFYFAGHGIAVDGDTGPAGYLLPSSARRSDPKSFLAMHELHRALAYLPVRHALVILDCCFAGTFRWSSLRDAPVVHGRLYRETFDRYVDSAAWQVLTSASSDQLALDVIGNHRGEANNRHSPFAAAMLEGLAGAADYTGDNLVTASELALYLRERVEPAIEALGHSQTPQLFALDRHERGEFVFQVPGRSLNLPDAPSLTEENNPYLGLRSFAEADADRFFGRGDVTRRLVDAVTSQRFTVIVGPSGSGKSSLVHAGLIPALRANDWCILPTQRPGRNPLAALQALLPDALRDIRAPAERWKRFVATRDASQRRQPWLVVIDQLEEVFTQRAPVPELTEFLITLADALQLDPSFHLVVTVRSDAEPQFHDGPLGASWTDARFLVPAMSREELRDAIEKPATGYVLYFHPSRLIDRMIDDVALLPAPLPLLSFALSELYAACWRRWRHGERDRGLREADYLGMGSVARALTQRASSLHDELVATDPAYAVTVRNVFMRMVANVSGELARRRVRLDELVYDDAAENTRVENVLECFHDARLISFGTERDDAGANVPYAEPTHDELVRGWPKVSYWLGELDNPVPIRSMTAAVGAAARAWHESGHSPTYLWSDARVELASSITNATTLTFNKLETSFVATSVRRRRQRRARLIIALLLIIAVLGTASVIAVWQRRQAVANEQIATASLADVARERDNGRRALGRTYEETARELLLDGHPMQAIPYLLEAANVSGVNVQRRMLFWSASRNMPIGTPIRHALAFSRDGLRVVTESDERVLEVWDVHSGRLLATLGRHAADGLSARFSADGRKLVTASEVDPARVWDATTGAQIGTSMRHSQAIDSVELSADGMRVITGSRDRTARVWDAATGTPIGAPMVHSSNVEAAFSPDGRRVISTDESSARVWDAATGAPLTPWLRHTDAVTAARSSSDGRLLVTASWDKTVIIWDQATGDRLTQPLRHDGRVQDAAFSPDGRRVATVGDDRRLRIWDLTTGRVVTPPIQHEAAIQAVAFSPDGTRLVTGSDDNTARIWDAFTGEPLGPAIEHQNRVTRVDFTPDGMRLLTVEIDGTGWVWDAPTDRLRRAVLQHPAEVLTIEFDHDGKRLVTACRDKIARIWNAATGEMLVSARGHTGPLWNARFSADGARIVTASADGTARVWDSRTGKLLSSPIALGTDVLDASFSPDGTKILVRVSDVIGQPRMVRVFDAMTAQPVTPPMADNGIVQDGTFSPNGRLVATAVFGAARVWDASSGELLASISHPGYVSSVAFSPDSALLVSGADKLALVSESRSGRILGKLVHDDRVAHVAFSHDGRRIVTAANTTRLWDARTGNPLTPAMGSATVDAAFSADGIMVVTAGRDNTARLWDVTTGKQLTLPLVHRSLVRRVRFSPDGSRVATGSLDSTACIWELRTAEGTLAEWSALGSRSPYTLLDGLLTQRPVPEPTRDNLYGR